METFTYRGVTYLGGIPSFPHKAGVTLTLDEHGVQLMRWGSCKSQIAIQSIGNLQIVPYLQFDPPGFAEKSVIGRAAIGGLLLGPLGMVVGGMSGMGQKQSLTLNQKIHRNDFVLVMEGIDGGLPFRCGFIFQSLILKERAASKPLEQIQRMRLLFARHQAAPRLPIQPKESLQMA